MYTESIMSDTPSSTSASLARLTAKTAQQEEIFAKSFPEVYTFIQEKKLLDEQAEPMPPSVQLTPPDLAVSTLASQITFEEHATVLQKTRDISQLPPGTLDTEVELYLEQQLSEILNFDVSVEVEGQRLPHTHGVIQALPHFKTTPTDSLENHSYPHATFSGKRSFFGWVTSGTSVDQDPPAYEQYAVSLPLFLLPGWSEKFVSLKKWYAYRKVIIINPAESIGVVARIADTFPLVTAKYQFGASPEVILEAKCWSPKSLGKVLIFFVTDETDTVPLGPVSLEYSGDS